MSVESSSTRFVSERPQEIDYTKQVFVSITNKIVRRIHDEEDPYPVIKEIEKELTNSPYQPSFLYGRTAVIGVWRTCYAIGLWRTCRYEEAVEELKKVKAIIDGLGNDSLAGERLLSRAQTVANYPGLDVIEGLTDEARERYRFAQGFGDESGDTESEEEQVEVSVMKRKAPERLRLVESDFVKGIVAYDDMEETLASPTIAALDFSIPAFTRKRKATASPAVSTGGGLVATASMQFSPRPLSPLVATASMQFSPRPLSPLAEMEPPKTSSSMQFDALDIAVRSSKRPQHRQKIDHDDWAELGMARKEFETLESVLESQTQGQLRHISFEAEAVTLNDEVVKVVGSEVELGSWDPVKGLILETSTGGLLVGTVSMAKLGDHAFEWKLVRAKKDGSDSTWERKEAGNRVTQVSAVQWSIKVDWED
ncbi:hypothetical protein JCM5353_002849 [Sporobolomyces roseus]